MQDMGVPGGECLTHTGNITAFRAAQCVFYKRASFEPTDLCGVEGKAEFRVTEQDADLASVDGKVWVCKG